MKRAQPTSLKNHQQGVVHYALLVSVVFVLGFVAYGVAQRLSSKADTNAVTATSSSIKIATWNIFVYRDGRYSQKGQLPTSEQHAVDGVTTVGQSVQQLANAGADIISLQEVHLWEDRADIKQKMKQIGYDGYTADYQPNNKNVFKKGGSGNLPASIPIYWNTKKFELFKEGAYYTVKDQVNDGADDTRYFVWVGLKDRATGRTFLVFNAHPVAGVQNYDEGTALTGAKLTNYANYMDKLGAKLKERTGDGRPIFITGDFNANYRTDSTTRSKDLPYSRMNALGFKSNWQLIKMPLVGTFKKDDLILDYVFTLTHPAVQPKDTSIYPDLLGSDHHAVLYDLNLKK